MMKLSEEGLDLLVLNEGFKPYAYPCSRGRMTIGYGSTWNYDEQRPVKEGDSITKEKAKEWKDLAVDDIEGWINSRGWDLNQAQFDALVNLIYNIGPGAFRRTKAYYYIGTGNWRNVKASWLSINKVWSEEKKRLVVCDGLVTRRAREWELFSRDLW
jgi:lysozyme